MWGPTNSSFCVPETTDTRCLIFFFQIPSISHSEYKIQEHLPSIHRSCDAVGCAAHLWQGKQLLCCILLSVICFVTMIQGYTCQIVWECSDCEQLASKNARMPDIHVALTCDSLCSVANVNLFCAEPNLWFILDHSHIATDLLHVPAVKPGFSTCLSWKNENKLKKIQVEGFKSKHESKRLIKSLLRWQSLIYILSVVFPCDTEGERVRLHDPRL